MVCVNERGSRKPQVIINQSMPCAGKGRARCYLTSPLPQPQLIIAGGVSVKPDGSSILFYTREEGTGEVITPVS
jgi:hypothetical protein